MTEINYIFVELEHLIKDESQNIKENFDKTEESHSKCIENFKSLKSFLKNIITIIDSLSEVLKNDETILVSVKNQKCLRTCFQIVDSLGISRCLIPGVGIAIEKRCSTFEIFPDIILDDDEKYELLTECTDFFTRSYSIPVHRSIIVTLHLSDYLAALIQLSFAPLKKPGNYSNYIMTELRYNQLLNDKQKYSTVYENFVRNCFQPVLIKELLVLQSERDPPLPNFVKQVVCKELSQRLLASEGLLSLTRCFIESYEIDTGFDWKKIEMICKIITVVHGNLSESEYLDNICSQINKTISLNNTQYITTAVTCLFELNKKFPKSNAVNKLTSMVFEQFSCNYLISKSNLYNTTIMTKQEIEHHINLLHINLCVAKVDWPVELWAQNVYVLFLLGMKCTTMDLRDKIKSIIIKCLEVIESPINVLHFGLKPNMNVSIDESESGLVIKYVKDNILISRDLVFTFFVEILKNCSQIVMEHVFNSCLRTICNQFIVINNIDDNYAAVLQLLIQISGSPKLIESLKNDPANVLEFIEHVLLKNIGVENECVTIALVLLNTILANTNCVKRFQQRLEQIIPILKTLESNEGNYNSILCKEALSLISDVCPKTKSLYSEAIDDVYHELIPIRSHGIIQLTKLLEEENPEAVANKHRIFCILQEQLKHPDSYIYLAAINCMVALSTYCAEDVLHVLCKEFLNVLDEEPGLQTKEAQNQVAELRLKVGDIIVKITKRLGEKAVAHKTLLLNTMLCACRDDDPFIRTSALSNLAEIAQVINYKLGTIIFEILNCIWNILATDKTIECRRAAVMIITSLFKGLGRYTLVKLKSNLLPIYRALKSLYKDPNEDSVLRLHAQLALEELNDIVTDFLLTAPSSSKTKILQQ